jgi:ribosomal protein S12 methylthiotransferase
MGIKVGVVVLGCPKNIAEAQGILGLLKDKGFDLVGDFTLADIVLIHTCSFIKKARLESENCIKKVLKIKAQKNIKVYATGCLPQLLKDDIYKKFPGLDGFIGTGELDKIADIISGAQVDLSFKPGGLTDIKHRIIGSAQSYAYLKIAEGCNHKCSFCIIGDLRGKYKSLPQNKVLAEAQSLTDAGIKEIILIAQDTTSYGRDIYGKLALDGLMRKLSRGAGASRIRLLYAYPSSINNKLLTTINFSNNICNYIDIPIQHVSGKILRLMRRPLNTRRVVENIKNKFPDIMLRTSMIVGFPQETDSDIYELIDFIKQGYFLYSGVFEYSPPPNAKTIKGMPPSAIIKDRRIAIENAQYDVFKKWIAGHSGEIEVLIDDVKREAGGVYKYFARADFQAPEIDGGIVFSARESFDVGSFVKVQVSGHKGYNIFAKVKLH